MKKQAWKVIGRVKEKDGMQKYHLGYTSNPEKNKKYYVKNGWKEDDLIYEPNEGMTTIKTIADEILELTEEIMNRYPTTILSTCDGSHKSCR